MNSGKYYNDLLNIYWCDDVKYSPEICEITYINKGWFGSIYKCFIKETSETVIVKKSKKIYTEDYIFLFMNIEQKNIMKIYDTLLNKNYSISILEYGEYSFFDFINTHSEKHIIVSLFFQLVLSIYLLNTEYNFIHNDIKLDNLMVNIVSDEYIEYNINDNIFLIKTYGYKILIIDHELGYTRKNDDDRDLCKITNLFIEYYHKIIKKIVPNNKIISIIKNTTEFKKLLSKSTHNLKNFYNGSRDKFINIYCKNFLNMSLGNLSDTDMDKCLLIYHIINPIKLILEKKDNFIDTFMSTYKKYFISPSDKIYVFNCEYIDANEDLIVHNKI